MKKFLVGLMAVITMASVIACGMMYMKLNEVSLELDDTGVELVDTTVTKEYENRIAELEKYIIDDYNGKSCVITVEDPEDESRFYTIEKGEKKWYGRDESMQESTVGGVSFE